MNASQAWEALLAMVRTGSPAEVVAALHEATQRFTDAELNRGWLQVQRRLNRARARARVLEAGGTWKLSPQQITVAVEPRALLNED